MMSTLQHYLPWKTREGLRTSQILWGGAGKEDNMGFYFVELSEYRFGRRCEHNVWSQSLSGETNKLDSQNLHHLAPAQVMLAAVQDYWRHLLRNKPWTVSKIEPCYTWFITLLNTNLIVSFTESKTEIHH